MNDEEVKDERPKGEPLSTTEVWDAEVPVKDDSEEKMPRKKSVDATTVFGPPEVTAEVPMPVEASVEPIVEEDLSDAPPDIAELPPPPQPVKPTGNELVDNLIEKLRAHQSGFKSRIRPWQQVQTLLSKVAAQKLPIAIKQYENSIEIERQINIGVPPDLAMRRVKAKNV